MPTRMGTAASDPGLRSWFCELRRRSLTSTGVFGGGQLGYNMQTGNFDLGLEVDLGGMANDGEQSFVASADELWSNYWSAPNSNPPVVRIKSEGEFYGDVTGRVGYAWGPRPWCTPRAALLG